MRLGHRVGAATEVRCTLEMGLAYLRRKPHEGD